jgi:hypothetical protein
MKIVAGVSMTLPEITRLQLDFVDMAARIVEIPSLQAARRQLPRVRSGAAMPELIAAANRIFYGFSQAQGEGVVDARSLHSR